MTKDEERRAKENADLVDRMKRGESLARCSPTDTWFQPRPIIKKDPVEIKKLYGNSEKLDK